MGAGALRRGRMRTDGSTSPERHDFEDTHDTQTRCFITWMLYGASAFSLGAAQASLAGQWGLPYLVSVGVLTACIGACYLGVAMLALLLNRKTTYMRLHGSDADALTTRIVRRAPALLRKATPLTAVLCAYMAILLLVHTCSPDRPTGAFPSGCPAGPTDPGCDRVALANASVGAAEPLQGGVARSALHHAVVQWIESQPRATLLEGWDSPEFVHARFASFFWGFADDLYVRMTCTPGGLTVVEVQGNLRIGKGDLGVNQKRNRQLLQHIQQLVDTKALEPDACDSPSL